MERTRSRNAAFGCIMMSKWRGGAMRCPELTVAKRKKNGQSGGRTHKISVRHEPAASCPYPLPAHRNLSMKTARLLLAALSLATLAACGTESITEPATRAPGSARQELTPSTPEATTSGDTGPGQSCNGIISVTTDPSGVTVETCLSVDRGPFVGSGG